MIKPKFDHLLFLKTVTGDPGVYQMRDAKHQLLYVGKARHLKNRLSSYFRKNISSLRIQSMVSQIASIDITVTRNELEALILENQLIKNDQPKYNIIFRDDKSYPHLCITHHAFPRLEYRRFPKGFVRDPKAFYFGPYPSSFSAKQTTLLLQQIFLLRTCSDSEFKKRSRPCMQYQIGRCGAPCVNYVNDREYAQGVLNAQLLLTGKSDAFISVLHEKMQSASENEQYELAATYRDKIQALRDLLRLQCLSMAKGNADIIACAIRNNQACVFMFSVRNGQITQQDFYSSACTEGATQDEIVQAFLNHYYLSENLITDFPEELIVQLSSDYLSDFKTAYKNKFNKTINMITQPKTHRAEWLQFAEQNAIESLKRNLVSRPFYQERLQAFMTKAQLEKNNIHLECFDISHHRGEGTVGSCIVFNDEGECRSANRIYKIKTMTDGDDIGALTEMFKRRLMRIQKNELPKPDVWLIDGGLAQFRAAKKILAEYNIALFLMAIQKGEGRKPGLETIYFGSENNLIRFEVSDPILLFLQMMRDRAHESAIRAGRKQLRSARMTSSLEKIAGVGKKRRLALLKHFMGLQGLKGASIEEIAAVPGVSLTLAKQIYAR